jgi:hypothetical protein
MGKFDFLFLPHSHSSFHICFEFRRRHIVEPFAQLAPQFVGQARSLRISVAVGKRVEPIESKASCKRIL